VNRFISEALAQHDRAGFRSGNERIDRYFHTTVSQDVRRSYAACYVLTERDTGRLAGFYTLTAYSVPLSDIAPELVKKLPRYPSVPAILIGWLGRDLVFRSAGIGTMLLYDAIGRIDKLQLGVHAICVHAIDEAAVTFYREHEFLPLVGRPQDLFLPMHTAVRLIEGPAVSGGEER
jgi:ribosomal protein S18 acetylase RimI-like enzyme